MRLARFRKIFLTLYRFGLDELFSHHPKLSLVRRLLGHLPARDIEKPLPERVRLALESLGPIFVKFGQVLSTRRDLLPPAYADELAKLQDRVLPFSGDVAVAQIERNLGRPLDQIFAEFNRTPIASASVAQVHYARLRQADGSAGREVAVKVLRPGIKAIIEQDLALLKTLAGLVERYLADGKRLKPREVVAEFDKYLHDELDLMHEAANASQLRRNFTGSTQLIVPEVFFDYCTREVLVLEWMRGIPVGQIDRLREAGVDLQKLSRFGVEIFFTQVFRHGFFHADMHPGNIFVADDGRYIALDFGNPKFAVALQICFAASPIFSVPKFSVDKDSNFVLFETEIRLAEYGFAVFPISETELPHGFSQQQLRLCPLAFVCLHTLFALFRCQSVRHRFLF